MNPEGKRYLKALYFLPTDALLLGASSPGRTGPTTCPGHLLRPPPEPDPRKNFARFLYLAERMTEALEYQYDKMGYFYSNP